MGGLTVEEYSGDLRTFFEKRFEIIGPGVFNVGIKTAGADTALYGVP